MKKVAIVNYGMGNLDSVCRAVEECGEEPVITNDPGEIKTADLIIIPGVGAFKEGVANIKKANLDVVIKEQIFSKKVPLLGICLGMQLLATKGYEDGETNGLGWIEGEVVRFKSFSSSVRIPHVGWNEVHFVSSSPLFEGLTSGKDFYFVHSYYFVCKRKKNELAKTPYCNEFASVIGQDNIFGVQFHPEKSQKAGFKILRNFLAL